MPTNYTSVKSNPCGDGPGIYYDFEVPSGTCALNPGLYVVTGSWTMKNNSILNSKAGGVTLYFTCASATTHLPRPCNTNGGVGEAGGSLDAKNGLVTLTAPGPSPAPPSGALPGYVITYDRQNRSGLGLQGNGETTYTGTIYAPKALMEFPGNSYIDVVNGPVIVGRLYGNGNTGGVNLTNVNAANIPVPPEAVSLDQ